MEAHQASEAEIDERLNLDKRRDPRAFCTLFETDEVLPAGFYELQDKITKGLIDEFWANYDDGVDRSHMKPWRLRLRPNKFFFFPEESMPSERIIVELSTEILTEKLIVVIWSYLEKCQSRYCVIAAVFEGRLTGSNYLGRFILNLDEVAVETTLCQVWSKQVSSIKIIP